MKINQGLSDKASYDPLGVLAFEGDDWRRRVTCAWVDVSAFFVLCSNGASVTTSPAPHKEEGMQRPEGPYSELQRYHFLLF